MRNVNSIEMKEQEENEFEKWIGKHVTVGERLPYRDDDPFLVKKLEEAYKTFEEAPLPDWLVRKMNEKD
jgi:hypothetical protein